ncbi:MAG: hypothetical protein PWQ08_970 [Clostridiales bacterium]|nr:hypothetical protein [Clostridiales bacterium]
MINIFADIQMRETSVRVGFRIPWHGEFYSIMRR